MYEDLIQNTALLVALTTLYTLLWRVTGPRPALGKLLSGLLFGVVAIVGMQLPFRYAPGVIYDGRSIILSMAGLFGGATTALVSTVLAGIYRANLGGSGVWAGVATIVGCAGVGVAFRRIYGNRPERMGALSLYGFGIGVHIVMLGCQLLIQPWPAGLAVLGRIWLPILIVFPPATVLTGLLIGTEQRRLRAERRLKESETLLSRSQSVGHVGSWELDLGRNRLTWSDEVYRLFGFDPYGFTPTYDAFLDGVHPDDRAAVDAAYRRSRQEGRDQYQIEHRIIRRDDGRIRNVYQKCEHFRDASGQIARSVGIIQDLTDVRQAQEKIISLNQELEMRVAQRTAELLEANQELEDFVYSVSHDLRAPLRSVSGFAEIIGRRHKGSLNEEGRHYFDNIVKAGKQMGDLIDDLLKFSRLGRKSIKVEPVALDDVLKVSLKTLADQIAQTNARIHLPDQGPVIQGDLTLLTHIFINLLENAIKYRKPDLPPVIDIRFEDGDPYVVVSVSDNGIGIEPEYHEKIFKMFQRLHRQEDYPGTGIGLAAVKKAVQMLGGEVRVESQVGVGSVFKVHALKTKTA